MALIYHQVLIDAPRSKVYEALTTQRGISQWWTSDCVVEPKVGSINEFRVGTQAHYRMKVVHLQTGYSVEWKCVNQHDDWSGTQLSFHLADKGGQTCLDFKQSGFASESEAFGAANFQWGRHLLSLKELCETDGNSVNREKVSVPANVIMTAKD